MLRVDLRDPKKKDIVVTYNRGYNSKYIDHTLLVYSHFLKEFKKDYNVILFANDYSESFIKKFVDKVGLFDGWFSIKDIKSDDWGEYKSNFIKEIKSLPLDPVSFIELGGLLNTIFKRGKEKQWNRAMKENKNTRFLSVKKGVINELGNILFCKEFSIPFNHFLIDSQECDYSLFSEMNGIDYRRWFGYDSESVNFKFHPFLKHYYSDHIESHVKSIDWIIGFAILTPDRKWLSKYYEYFKSFENSKIYLKDKYNNVDTFIPKDQYLNELRKSRFTLMMPPYDKDFFSMIRFLESIAVGTMPMIHESVFYNEAVPEKFRSFLNVGDSFSSENVDRLIQYFVKLKNGEKDECKNLCL